MITNMFLEAAIFAIYPLLLCVFTITVIFESTIPCRIAEQKFDFQSSCQIVTWSSQDRMIINWLTYPFFLKTLNDESRTYKVNYFIFFVVLTASDPKPARL